MKKRIFANRAQREALTIDAKVTVVIGGRGLGKGLIFAAAMIRNVQRMPRSSQGYVAANAKRALTNTLPSVFQHWEEWGFKRDIHWVVGRKPPKNFGWPEPYFKPENWENTISFYNGTIIQIISQDRSGTSNSLSIDFLYIDEAKFIDYEQLKDETLPANRGNGVHFGHIPQHHGMLIASDLPIGTKGSWFLSYEKHKTQELVELIKGCIAEEFHLKKEMEKPQGKVRAEKDLAEVRRALDKFRRECIFCERYSTLENLEVLGIDFVKSLKRDLPPLIYRTSVLCLDVEQITDGFYSALKPRHRYMKSDFHYLDSLNFDSSKLSVPDSRMDGDLMHNKPLCVAFDYNANINWLVVGQSDEVLHRANIVKSFFVKYERKLPELVDDFCKYYEHFPLHIVVFYYDATALGSNYAVSKDDFHVVIRDRFRLHGWRVIEKYIGKPWSHGLKMLYINEGLMGRKRLQPFFNDENNEYLMVSISLAGVYNGKKDKRGEKLAETEEDKLEGRTDGSDAFDTLYIGMEKYPVRMTVMTSTSDLKR